MQFSQFSRPAAGAGWFRERSQASVHVRRVHPVMFRRTISKQRRNTDSVVDCALVPFSIDKDTVPALWCCSQVIATLTGQCDTKEEKFSIPKRKWFKSTDCIPTLRHHTRTNDIKNIALNHQVMAEIWSILFVTKSVRYRRSPRYVIKQHAERWNQCFNKQAQQL